MVPIGILVAVFLLVYLVAERFDKRHPLDDEDPD